jgi:hypothetical protein
VVPGKTPSANRRISRAALSEGGRAKSKLFTWIAGRG